MYKNKTVAVVIPAYNEETQLPLVFESMPSFVDHMVVINDRSQDRTADVVRDASQKNHRVLLIEHEANRGVGGAIASGYIWCAGAGVDVAVVMAGDAQMDPADLSRLLDPVVTDDVDCAKGNRLLVAGASRKIPKLRYFGISVLSLFTKVVSGYWHLGDSQCGYVAINKRVLASIDWNQMYPRYGQPNDLLVRLNLQDYRVCDVPVRPLYDIGEKSAMRIHVVVFTISWLLVKLFFWRLKEKYLSRRDQPRNFK